MSAECRQTAAERGDHYRQLDALLRQCVACGLCLPHCATYLATGNEADSPRGRLILLRAILAETGAVPTAAAQPTEPSGALAALDRCIGCRACETACPSGVPYALLAHGQSLAVEAKQAATVPGAGLLDRRQSLSWLRRLVAPARIFARIVAGRRWRRRLADRPAGLGALVRLLGSLPAAPQSDAALCRLLDRRLATASSPPTDAAAGDSPVPAARSDATTPRPPDVVFFRGCANASLLPGSARRLRELLAAAGCRVTVPARQDCCGAVADHSGRSQRAAALRSANLDGLSGAVAGGAVLVAEAAGCALALRDYPAPLAGAVRDATVLLAGLALPPLAPVPLRVVVHDPCHLRHGLGFVAEPRRLLRRIPQLVAVEPEEPEVCCGSGGIYSLRHRALAAAMGRRKAEALASAGGDLVVTSNPGCLGQIADGLALVAPDLPVLPLTDLLWYAWRRGGGRCAKSRERLGEGERRSSE